MTNLHSSLFFSNRLKTVGALLLIWAIIAFFLKQAKHGIWDVELLAGLFCWGVCFVFFAKEKIEDERIHHLKFRALAWGLPLGLAITHLINYLFLSAGEPDAGKYLRSISAYVSIAIILTIATSAFYYLKFKENRI